VWGKKKKKGGRGTQIESGLYDFPTRSRSPAIEGRGGGGGGDDVVGFHTNGGEKGYSFLGEKKKEKRGLTSVKK